MKVLVPRVCLALFLALMLIGRASAQDGDAARVLTLINQVRINAGLAPLALNPQLTASAQAHADDMARNGVSIGHGGSDGSTPAMRILSAGYRPYTWGPVVGENWAAYRTVDESMNAWMSDQSHRGNILRLEYRELGVGVAPSPSGVPILVTDFGAQPNVLPVFLNGTGPSVTLTLTNEDAVPAGDGANVIGRALSVEISTDAGFSQVRTLPFATSIQYTSPDGKPISTVYVRFHDGLGRATVSTAAASGLVSSAAAASSSTATSAPTRKPAPTRRTTATSTQTPPPPSATLAPTPDLTPLAGDSMRVGEAASATPSLREAEIVRHPLNTPAYVGAVPAATAPEPILTPLANGLFAAAGLLLLLAAVTGWRKCQ